MHVDSSKLAQRLLGEMERIPPSQRDSFYQAEMLELELQLAMGDWDAAEKQAPRDVDLRVAKVMIETYGLPPWDPDEYAAVNAEFERDQARIEELYAKFLEDLSNARPT